MLIARCLLDVERDLTARPGGVGVCARTSNSVCTNLGKQERTLPKPSRNIPYTAVDPLRRDRLLLSTGRLFT